MRRYTISAPQQNVELTDITLMGIVYECEYITPDEFDAIPYLAVNNSATFYNDDNTKKFKITRTE